MKLTLEAFTPSLAAWWQESRGDPESVRYNPFAPSTLEQLRERLAKASADLADFPRSEAFLWVIRVDGELVGHVSIQQINRMMLTAELGYAVSASARGKGVATQAVRMVMRDCFTRTPLRKLVAFVHEDNVPSRRVLEKVGFRLEGLLREHFLVGGAPANEAIYGILRGDLE
ncbi:MAG: GNAT family N-acetyltransferase [Bacteriovoracia bacterium]